LLCKFGSSSTSGIFGAFSNLSSWKSDSQKNECYLFSLTPKFNIYLPQISSSDKNTEDYFTISKNGIGKFFCFRKNFVKKFPGFGKTKDNHYRLWIDGVESEKSYAESEDEIFCPGSLIDDKNNFINIEYVEIWGLSSILTGTDQLQMSNKSWITFNQDRIPKLSTNDPKIGMRKFLSS